MSPRMPSTIARAEDAADVGDLVVRRHVLLHLRQRDGAGARRVELSEAAMLSKSLSTVMLPLPLRPTTLKGNSMRS